MNRNASPDKAVEELRKRIEKLGDPSVAQSHFPEISRQVDLVAHEIAQRKQAEEALRESERRLFTLMSNLPGMAYRCLDDDDWTMKFVSEGCLHLTGYKSAEMTENRVIAYNDLIHPEDRESVFAQVSHGVANHKPFQLVYRIRTKAGHEKWVWEQGVGVYENSETPKFLEGFIADITPLKKAETESERLLYRMRESLKEQHCLYRIVKSLRLQDSPDAIFRKVATIIPEGWRYPEITCSRILIGEMIYVSSPFEETPWRQDCDIIVNGTVQGSIEIFYTEERPSIDEGPFTKEERQLISSIANLLGRFIERKQADEELRRSEGRFRALVEATSDWIWEVNSKGVYTYVSPRIKSILGYEPEEVLGRTPFDLMPPEEADRFRESFHDMVKNRKTINNLENNNLHKDGRCVLLETHGVPIFDSDGIFQGYRGVDRDITERKRAEEERRAFEIKVQHTQKLESLGVLAGGIAHDFNNMLMAILGNADLARMKLDPDSPVFQNLEAIVKTSEHAAALCKQMLAYSGRGKFVIEPLDFSQVIAEMAGMLKVSISKKVELKYDFDNNLPLIEADASQLRQVAMNLITNASEAIDEAGGVITLRTGVIDCDETYLHESYLDENLPPGQYVFLEVSDTGCGLSRETQNRLFDPFFTTKSTGRGLGLSAVLGIVRSHRGAIKVYSEVGHGTLFKVLFPARDTAIGRMSNAQESNLDSQSLLEGTVLLVDDEEHVREVVTRMLMKLGLSVLVAVDGLDAVEVYREHADVIDCVMLDLTMPRMNGEEACREIRQLRPDCRVMLSSGYSEQEISQNFLGEDHLWFIQKPYQVSTLRQKMREILHGDED